MITFLGRFNCLVEFLSIEADLVFDVLIIIAGFPANYP
jgi:hypothetical protein